MQLTFLPRDWDHASRHDGGLVERFRGAWLAEKESEKTGGAVAEQGMEFGGDPDQTMTLPPVPFLRSGVWTPIERRLAKNKRKSS